MTRRSDRAKITARLAAVADPPSSSPALVIAIVPAWCSRYEISRLFLRILNASVLAPVGSARVANLRARREAAGRLGNLTEKRHP